MTGGKTGIELVSFSGMVPLRWYSCMNLEMDCVYFVLEKDSDNAYQAIKRGVDDFWEGGCDSYGKCIEWQLRENNIPFVAVYPEWYEWLERQECAPEWDEWADSLDALMVR